jgi:hypothetical protein
MSPRQKSIASSIPKPRDPFIKTLSIIDVGTAVEALVISSDILWDSKLSAFLGHNIVIVKYQLT